MNAKTNKEINYEAVATLQEVKIDDLDILLGGAGHGVNTIVVGIVYRQSSHVVSFWRGTVWWVAKFCTTNLILFKK